MTKNNHRHKHGDILTVDQNFIPMSEISRRKSLLAIYKGKATIVDLATFEQHSDFTVRYYVILFKVRAHAEVKLAGGKGIRSIIHRDNHKCQYCGKRGDTVDHIIPICQGGPTTWMNLACACKPCNQRKGGRTPEQAGMVLLNKPMGPRARLHKKFEELVARAQVA